MDENGLPIENLDQNIVVEEEAIENPFNLYPQVQVEENNKNKNFFRSIASH
jgi:hypothetical protein